MQQTNVPSDSSLNISNSLVRYVSTSGNILSKSPSDAGFDIRSIERKVIQPKNWDLIRTGIILEMPPTMYAQVHSRSGLALRGIDVGAGVVDSSYRSDVKILLINNSEDSFSVNIGDRVAQIIFHPLISNLNITQVTEVKPSERGVKGFGSSGVQ